MDLIDYLLSLIVVAFVVVYMNTSSKERARRVKKQEKINLNARKNIRMGMKRGLKIGVIVSLPIAIFMLAFITNVTAKNRLSIFKNHGFYLSKKYFIKPKINDWVSYSINNSKSKLCSSGRHVGKIEKINLDMSYIIKKEFPSKCDSSILGSFEPHIHSVIYPEYEVSYLTKLFYILKITKSN